MEARLLEDLVLVVRDGREGEHLVGYVKSRVYSFAGLGLLFFRLVVQLEDCQGRLIEFGPLFVVSLPFEVNEVSFLSALDDYLVESLGLENAQFEEVEFLGAEL